MLYGTITEHCTTESCPVMSAGPKYVFSVTHVTVVLFNWLCVPVPPPGTSIIGLMVLLWKNLSSVQHPNISITSWRGSKNSWMMKIYSLQKLVYSTHNIHIVCPSCMCYCVHYCDALYIACTIVQVYHSQGTSLLSQRQFLNGSSVCMPMYTTPTLLMWSPCKRRPI